MPIQMAVEVDCHLPATPVCHTRNRVLTPEYTKLSHGPTRVIELGILDSRLLLETFQSSAFMPCLRTTSRMRQNGLSRSGGAVAAVNTRPSSSSSRVSTAYCIRTPSTANVFGSRPANVSLVRASYSQCRVSPLLPSCRPITHASSHCQGSMHRYPTTLMLCINNTIECPCQQPSSLNRMHWITQTD